MWAFTALREGPGSAFEEQIGKEKGWNKQPEAPVSEELTESQIIILKDHVCHYFTGSRRDDYWEWGRKFFGDKALMIHCFPGKPWPVIMSTAGVATIFPHCCGYAEMEIEYGKWKGRLCHAWVSRKAGVIASINTKQSPYLKELTELGFRVVQDWHVNPNSGAKIMLLMFTFPQ